MFNSEIYFSPGKLPFTCFRKKLLFLLLVLSASCASVAPQSYKVQDSAPVRVDSLVAPDPEMMALIAPYKENISKEMNEIIGYAAKELTEGPVESALGNFVADLTEEKAEQYSGMEVDMGAITMGGLRVPVPEGAVRLRDIYELMPFENYVLLLELTAAQTLQLFEYAARTKDIAISGSRLVTENGKPVSVEIGGRPFDPEKTYTLAISDYLANGGDNMEFLKDAKRLAVPDIKLRDVIIEKFKDLQAQGKKADANIEGRVVVK